jgi:hypothetical protein
MAGEFPKSISATNAPIVPGNVVHLRLPISRSRSTEIWSSSVAVLTGFLASRGLFGIGAIRVWTLSSTPSRTANPPHGRTTTTFEFEPVDDGARTLVAITESS